MKWVYRLCFAALAAVLLLPAAQRAEAQVHVVSVDGPGAAVAEGGMAVFTLSLPAIAGSNARTTPLTVNYSLGGSATSGDDYTHTGTSATFAASSTSETVSILITDDNLNEGQETLTLMLDSVDNASGFPGGATASGSASATISASDPISVTMEPPPDADPDTMGIQVNEASSAVFTLRLSGPSAGGVTVFVSLAGVGGVSPADLGSGAPSDVLIPAGDLTETFELLIDYDGEDETGEGFTYTITNVVGTDTGHGQLMLGTPVSQTILLVDTGPVRTLEVSAADADEGGNLVFTVTLTGPALLEAFDVAWSLDADMSSAEAADYSGENSGMLNFTPSMQSGEVSFGVVDDALNEGPETLVLTVASPCLSGICAVGGRPSGVSTLVPTLPIGNVTATATIGASDPIAVSLARRMGDSGRLVNDEDANYVATLGATASTVLTITVRGTVSGSSFESDFQVVAGETEVPVSFLGGRIQAALVAGSGEVQLVAEVTGVTGAPTGATAAPAGGGAASVSIPVVGWEISISPTDRSEVGEGGSLDFTVSLRGTPAPTSLTVNWSVSGSGTPAATAADFPDGAFPSGTLDLSGQTSGTITVQTLADTVDESAGAEGFSVVLGARAGTNAGATAIVAGTALAEIADTPRNLQVTVDSASTAEGSTAAFSIGFAAGSTAPESGTPTTVTWTLSGVEASDYTMPSAATGSLMFTNANWNTAQTVSVAIASDNLNEGSETLTLTLNNAAGGGGAGTGITMSNASTTIAASDPITYRFDSTERIFSEAGGANFTIFLDGATAGSAADITIPYTIGAPTSGIAAISGTDFTAPATQMATIRAGDDQVDIFIVGIDDDLNEAAESFRVILGGTAVVGAGGGAVTQGAGFSSTGTINDNDAITVSIADAADITEGSTAEFMVTLDHASATDVTVGYTVTTSGSPAPPFTDAGSGSLTITAPATTGIIRITADATNSINSGTRTITVALGTHTAAGAISGSGSQDVEVSYSTFSRSFAVAVDTGAGKTTDRDGAMAGVQVNEGDTLYFSVSLLGAAPETGNDASVMWAVSGATDDTTATGAALTFTNANYTAAQEVTFVVTDDNVNEAAESIGIALSGAMGGGGLGTGITTAGASVTIGASDPVTYNLVAPADVTETDSGTATMSFPVMLSGAAGGSAADITLSYTITSSGTAIGGMDYEIPSSPMVTISTGSITANIDITINADNLNEANETIFVMLSNTPAVGSGGGVVTPGTLTTISGTILDDDLVAGTVARHTGTPATVDEGGTAVFTVTLNHASAGVVTVSYTVTSSTTGYTPGDSGGGSIEFAAGETSRDITLTMPPSPALGSSDADGTVTVALNSISAALPGRGSSGGLFTSATVMVNYVDAAHSLAFTSPATSIVEGETATYTVTRTGPAITGSIVVSWTYAVGTTNPAAAADFAGGAVPAGGTLTFVGSEMEKTFEIAVADDADSEPDETFTLGLSAEDSVRAANGGVALGADVAVTITESDRPITLSVAPPAGGLTEGAAANFRVSFPESVITTAPVVVSWRLDGLGSAGAAANEDFEAAGLLGNLEIAAGQPGADLPITPRADALNEAAERVTLLLLSASGGGAIAAPVLHPTTNTASAEIAANDPVTVSLARASGESGEVSEGGTATFTATLSGASAGPVRVAYEITLGGAAPGARIADAGGGSIAVAAGALSADIAITINVDPDRNMGTEPLAISISTVTPGAGAGSATAGSPNSANATVRYVAALRTLEASEASVTGSEDSVTAAGETAFAEFTARMSGAPLVEAVMVDWTLEGADGANLPGTSGSSGLARNHGGDHTPDFGAARIAEPGGGAVNADGRSGTLVFPLGALVARTIRVPVLQDALNEGAERLTLRLMNPCPSSGVCRVGGGSDTIPTLQLGTNAQTATIPASDPIVLSVARDGTGAVVSGQDITYSVRFGTTMVNGVSTPIAPSAPLMVSLPLRVNGAASGVSVAATAAAGAATLTISVPAVQVAAAVDAVAPTGTPTVSLGAPVVSGAPDPAMVSVPQPGDAANPLPAPVQTSDWILARTLPGGDQAPEGLSYRVVFELRGSETPTDLFFTWQVAASGDNSAEAGDFGGSAAYSCGSTSATTPCTGFPGGRVDFAAGDSSREISIVIFDDSGAADGGVEGTQPEGFALTISALSGTDAGQVRYADAASDLSSAVTLQASIPALRVDLSLADATADEGGDAVFWLTLGNFIGGAATLSPIAVRYALVDGSAAAGADYTPPAELVTQIPAGSAEGARHAIAVALVADGVVEPPETFALTIARMDVSGGGGVVRLVDAAGAEQVSLSATGTITGAGDAARRRQQRVGALATVLDRQTALLATDAITARLARTQSGSGGGAELSIANRNLLGARAASAANGGSAGAMGGAAGGGAVSTGAQSTDSAAPELGLALYGAAGLGGAAAGLPGGAAGAGGTAAGAGGPAAGAGFGGLGAGLAGGANMGGRTALPNLAQLLGGSRFAFNVSWRDLPKRAAALASGVQVWGSGGFAELRGGPEAGLSYKGDTAAAFLGADVPVRDNLLAGLALGWTGGELDFTDRAGDFTTSGEFRNDALSVHPYLGWQISPHAKAWLVLGFGAGSVEIDESDSSGNSRSLNSGGSDMRMFSAGIAGEQPFSEATNLRLRFAITRVQSRVDLGVFDDGALLPKARGRSLRVGGEAEVGHRILFANGLLLRPFGTLGLRLDNTGAATPSAERGIENESFDWGGGLQATWPALGLDGRFAFTRQLNDTGHDEQRISATVNFDPGADSQGFTLALQTAMQSSTGGAGASGGFGAGAFGNTFGASASSAFGAGGNTFGASNAPGAGEMQQSLSGEIAYAMAFRLRQSGRSGWLTPYARFALRSADTRWAAGLRLAEPRSALQVGLEAALDRNSRNPANSTGTTTTGSGYNLLLTGQLRF